MKLVKNANNELILRLVQEQMAGINALKEEKDKPGWWASTKLYLSQTAHGIKRWTNKKIYDNNREQAVANIESTDPEIVKIKDFFSLFSEICYNQSRYSSIYDDIWPIEDPGTYCIQDSVKKKLNSWYKDNKWAFIKEMQKADQKKLDQDEKLEIIDSYAEDFLSTFDYYGLRIEAGARKLVVHTSEAKDLVRSCVNKNPDFLSDWRSQWHGSKLCIIDCFTHLFKFVWELDSESQNLQEQLGVATAGKPNTPSSIAQGNVVGTKWDTSNTAFASRATSGNTPSVRKILRAAARVNRDRSFVPTLERQKNFVFVNSLQSNTKFRKKWTGFCYNVTFDPYGEFDLDYWTNEASALKTKENKTDIDVYVEILGSVGTWVVADTVALKAAMQATRTLYAMHAARAALAAGTVAAGTTTMAGTPAAGASAGPPGWLAIVVVGCVVGVSLLISFDPFEWFSIRDDVEEELESMFLILKKLENLSKNKKLANQEVLNSLQKSFTSSCKNINRMIHQEMESGLQSDITSIKTNMDAKKLLLGNLTRSMQILAAATKRVSFNKKELDQKEIQEIIPIFKSMIRQIKNTSAEAAEWDDKLKRDTGIGSDIQSIEQVNENVLNTVPAKNALDFGEWPELIKEKYGVDISDIDNEEKAKSALVVARRADRNSMKKGKKNLKDRFPDVYKFLDDSDSGHLNGQAASFISWWEDSVPGKGKIIKDPKQTARWTIMHNSWAQCPNGLKSTTNYRGGKFLNSKLEGKSNISAFCGIGLAHSIANTSFYYTFGASEQIYGLRESILDRFYKLSKVNISKNGAVSLIDRGIYIQRLSVLVDRNLDYSSKERSLRSAIEKASGKLQKLDSIGTQDNVEFTKLKVFNILAKLFYKEELDAYKIIDRLIRLDNKVSDFMQKKAVELSKLSPDAQNTEVHKRLLSNLREAGAYKIMFFQALMNL